MGNICIDEFNKMRYQIKEKIHEVIERQTITISVKKSRMRITLNSRTSFLTEVNPIYGHIDALKTT